MTSTMPTVELAAIGELRQAFGGVSRTRAVQLSSEEGFPEPVAFLTTGKIWDMDQVRAWAERRGRTLHPIGE